MSRVVEAFNIGSGSQAVGFSSLIVVLVFASLFIIAAYICLNLFDELSKGKLSFKRFFVIVVKFVVMILILSYFLLHKV